MTVKAWVHTEDQGYSVWAPADLADQMKDSSDTSWVSLALVDVDEYICLRAKDITFIRREMTSAETQRKHTVEERK